MSWDLCTVTTQVARKDYDCDLLRLLSDRGFDSRDFLPVDWQAIQDARADGGLIRKGTKYVKTSGKWAGEFDVFRARQDIQDICEQDYIRDFLQYE